MGKLNTIREFLDFIVAYKRWWFVPFIIGLLLLGMLLMLAQSPAVAPFIYTMF